MFRNASSEDLDASERFPKSCSAQIILTNSLSDPPVSRLKLKLCNLFL